MICFKKCYAYLSIFLFSFLSCADHAGSKNFANSKKVRIGMPHDSIQLIMGPPKAILSYDKGDWNPFGTARLYRYIYLAPIGFSDGIYIYTDSLEVISVHNGL